MVLLMDMELVWKRGLPVVGAEEEPAEAVAVGQLSPLLATLPPPTDSGSGEFIDSTTAAAAWEEEEQLVVVVVGNWAEWAPTEACARIW